MEKDDGRIPWSMLITLPICAVIAAACVHFVLTHPSIYLDPRNYEPARIRAAIEEERRLNDPTHPRNPYREISQWYAKPAAPSR